MWTSLEGVGWPSDPVLLGAFPLADGHADLYSVPNSLAERDLLVATLLPVRPGIRTISARSAPSCFVGFSALLPGPMLPMNYD